MLILHIIVKIKTGRHCFVSIFTVEIAFELPLFKGDIRAIHEIKRKKLSSDNIIQKFSDLMNIIIR